MFLELVLAGSSNFPLLVIGRVISHVALKMQCSSELVGSSPTKDNLYYIDMARLIKKNSLLSMVNGMLIDLPTPANISYL